MGHGAGEAQGADRTDLQSTRVLPDKGEGWMVHYALFARAGFTDPTRTLADEQSVLLVDLDELGRGLEAD